MIPILYLSHCGSSIGGGEKQLAYLVTNIDQKRYQPLVVCPDDGVFVEHLKCADIPTVVLALPPWRKTKSLIVRYRAAEKLTALAKTHNAKLVHTSDSWLNPYLLHIRKRLGIPVISHVRTLLTTDQVRKYKFNGMDRIITISKEGETALIQAGTDAQKIDRVLNCVNLDAFQLISQPEPLTEYVVGIVGRIEPFKRQKEFIEIAAAVIAQNKNVRFHVIGAALNTPEHRAYEQEVRQSVLKYQLQKFVLFRGHRTDMPNVMQELDLLITLSAGSVIAEAMAAGKPVIGTPVGSAPDMIVHDVTGYVIPLHPMPEIVNKILAFATDSDLNIRIGQHARKHAEETFGIKAHVEKIQGIYLKFLTD
ncbi:glycosyltransferase family 4 protein [Candidatus Poribacteria bacterium]|nr:glycosyltransferase family 4 protein [Candidatus Poribacteria bacterium]